MDEAKGERERDDLAEYSSSLPPLATNIKAVDFLARWSSAGEAIFRHFTAGGHGPIENADTQEKRGRG